MRRINVIDPGGYTAESSRHLTVFYTGLYRALTFPRKLQEVDENGKMVHYSPYDPNGQVHPGPLVTDNGFWDTYRTVYPLLSLIYPEQLGDIVQGMLRVCSLFLFSLLTKFLNRLVECIQGGRMASFVVQSRLS